MATTQADIRSWLTEGKERGATHVIVATDTFDWDDFPVFVMPGEDVRARESQYRNSEKMLKVMEVYNLSMDWESQLNERRSFNY